MGKPATIRITAGPDTMRVYNIAKEVLGDPSDTKMYLWVPECTPQEAKMFTEDAAKAAENTKGPYLFGLVGYRHGSKAVRGAIENALRRNRPDNLVVVYIG